MTNDFDDQPGPTCPKCAATLPSPGAPCPDCTTLTYSTTRVSTPTLDPSEELEVFRSALNADYEILEELGRGGMAVVYRAREGALERDVAIKVLPLARTFDTEFILRFQQEARLAAALEHPHIIPVYRVGQSGQVIFFVMKYLEGLSVGDILKAQSRMEPREVEKMLVEVGGALDHAHGHKIVHRDVKPDNIMKDQTGHYVVMDFGIAKSLGGDQLTQTGESIGTPKYMSPESAKGAELDGRSDFYSLGVVAYQCLVGHAPFEGDDALSLLYSHVNDPVPYPSLDTDDARRVYSAIGRLLAKNPDDRTQNGKDLRDHLHQEVAPAGTTVRIASATSDPALEVARASPYELGRWLYGLVRWFRTRSRRFQLSAGVCAGALLFVGILGRDGAAAQCRAAMPDASDRDRELLVDPLGTVLQGAEIELSYIACGLPDDELFTAQVNIRPADGGGVVGGVQRFFGGGSDPLRVSWDDQADGFATSRTRTITPGELKVGAYRITLRVEDGGGREAETSHDFTVVDRSTVLDQ